MKYRNWLSEFKTEQICSTSGSEGEERSRNKNFNAYHKSYRKSSKDDISFLSPMRLKVLDSLSPKKDILNMNKKVTGKRQVQAVYYYEQNSNFQQDQNRRISLPVDPKLLHEAYQNPSRVSIPPTRTTPSSQKQFPKIKVPYYPEQQLHTPLKKHQILQETKPFKQFTGNKTIEKLKSQINQLTETINNKHPFFSCKLVQSVNNTSKQAQMRIEESVVFQRSVLDSFRILSKSQIKGAGFYEMTAIEKQVGFAVSFKSINFQNIGDISNQLNILKVIGENSPHIIKNYAGFLEKNQYLLIREYYSMLLRDMLDKFNEDDIKELCKQMISLFEYFTSIKLIYKGNFLTNVCYHAGLFKIRNFEFCSINKDTSQSGLRRKYLGVLREMMRVILGVDNARPYYSSKLKKDLKPHTIIFMNDLIKNGMGFIELKQHIFLAE